MLNWQWLSVVYYYGNFLRGQIPHPRDTKEVRNPDLWGRKIVLKPHPRAIIFKNPAKSTKDEIEIMKTSTEMLVCLEILKQWNILKP